MEDEKKEKRPEQRSNVKNSVNRLVMVGLSVLIQVVWFIVMFLRLNAYATWISVVTSFVTLAIVLRIYGTHSNAAVKMPWIILILALPMIGIVIFFLFGRSNLTKHSREKFEKIDGELFPFLQQDEPIFEQLEKKDIAIANQSRYIRDYAPYPVYRNTDLTYYDEAYLGLDAQIEELKKAEHFIFMEYHAIQESTAFLRLREVLAERAKAGVEVRVVYDDIGSVGFINTDFIKRMKSDGIECRVFNRVIPFVNVFMNNRDHRKITVIDGKVGFTGGYNLADEYFNLTHPYGYWKDTGLKLTGDAVRSLTITFLEMWNAIDHTDTEYQRFLPEAAYEAKEQGFVQPYADSPLDSEYVGENVYMNLLKNAKHEIFFVTPYLIIDDEMNRELVQAAKRGVDVRLVTPGIPDKKVIYQITRSYYARLAQSGVRIYEYTPGFVHAKMCVCDGEAATVGTINMDYRSLYLHFENGVFFYDMQAVTDVRNDVISMFEVSREVTEDYCSERSAALRGMQCILRLFAPLL